MPPLTNLLVITTFRPSETKLLTTLSTWAHFSDVHLAALIEESELPSLRKNIRLHSIFGTVLTYTYRAPSSTPFSSQSLKTSPTLQQVFDAFLTLDQFSSYIYINADLELYLPGYSVCAVSPTLIPPPGVVLLGSRRDYTYSRKHFSTYTIGYDLIGLDRETLHELLLPNTFHHYQIGEVGWDYLLPLSLPRNRILIQDNIPIYHKVHPTGSSSDRWSESILLVTRNIHKSWLETHNLAKIASIISLAIANLLPESDSRSSRSLSFLRKLVFYLSSRLAYYACIKYLLNAKCAESQPPIVTNKHSLHLSL